MLLDPDPHSQYRPESPDPHTNTDPDPYPNTDPDPFPGQPNECGSGSTTPPPPVHNHSLCMKLQYSGEIMSHSPVVGYRWCSESVVCCSKI
jgi:hypothetical protein